MPRRRTPSVHRYTTVYVKHDGVRVPFVRLSGRWLEAFGFKEGAKFTAFGEEDGRLVLTVYVAAPEVCTSPCNGSCAGGVQNGALSPRDPD